MGLIVEIDSTATAAQDDPQRETLQDRLRDLLPHFYPPHLLHTPKFISLLGHYDHENTFDDQPAIQWQWESDPMNFVNCPEAVAKLQRFLDAMGTDGGVDKSVMGALVPCVLRVANCEKTDLRRSGLHLLNTLYYYGNRSGKWWQFLQNANVHQLVKEAALVSMTNDDPQLIALVYEVTPRVTGSLSEGHPDKLNIMDKLMERSLFCLVHSKDDHEQRVEHWRGLSVLAGVMGVAFVRHFYWLFKTIEVLLPSITEPEAAHLSHLIAHIQQFEGYRERVDLRRPQIDAIDERINQLQPVSR